MPFAKRDRAPELIRGKAHVALERIGSRFREPASGRFPFKRNRPAPPPDDPHFENGLADREDERAETESTQVDSALVAHMHQVVADGVRKHRL